MGIYVRNLGPSRKCKIPMEYVGEDGTITDKCKVLSYWAEQYKTLYNISTDFFDQQFYADKVEELSDKENVTNVDNVLNRVFEWSEISQAVDRTKSYKTAGVDDIPNEVLKYTPVKDMLLSFFNLCFVNDLLPNLWLKALIFPLLKGVNSDSRDPHNYRGISMLSCLYKIYSSVINKRICNYADQNSLLKDVQNGFRSGRSCAEYIFTVNSIVENNISTGKSVYACFIDLRKAFDLVNKNLLCYKILDVGINGPIYRDIKHMYTDTLSAVKLNNYVTEWFQTTSGVKQGDTLSPTMFSIYINGLLEEIKNSNIGIDVADKKISVLAYADDIVLFSNNENDVQTLLDTVHEWCLRWRLSVNTNKTKVMHFRKSRKQMSDYVFKIGENALEFVTDYKYLGVVFNEHLQFKTAANLLSDSAGRALGMTINKCKVISDFGFHTFNTMFNNGVTPILNYGVGVWGYDKNTNQSCNNVYNRAQRYFLGVHKLTPLDGIHGDLGWVSLDVLRKVEAIRLWNRYVIMDQSRLTRHVFL